jgi:uncharacterized protein YndB with AHSA1/START domain
VTAQVEPIRRSVTVRGAPERAFSVFTDDIDGWWPTETHSRSAVELEDEDVKVERIEFQGRVGGHVLEHMSNGSTLSWAEVVVWEPPRRVVLAWRPHSRPQTPTEIEVTFTAEDGGTLVELEHRGWERLEEDFRDLYERYATGWIETLGRFADAAEEQVA